MYINFICPPLPHLIVGGISNFREGDSHPRRVLQHTFDLLYMIQGELSIEEHKTSYELHKGDFLILPPQRLHRGSKCCPCDTSFYWLHFYTTGTYDFADLPVIESGTIEKSSQQFRKEPFHVSLPQYGKILPDLQQQMCGYLESITQVRINKKSNSKRFFDTTSSQLKQQQLFFSILTMLCDAVIPQGKKDPAADIFQYIVNHYQEPLQLKDLAEKFSFHPGYIIRLLKKRYQKTPLQLLLSIRLEKSAQSLAETNDSIEKISFSTGFLNQAYFSKVFKKAFHCTPTEYRQNRKSVTSIAEQTEAGKLLGL